MKKLLLLVLSMVANNAYSCEDVYAANGNWLGCKIPKHDTVLNSVWISPVINIYGQNRYEGTTYFKIDKNGRYTARTLIRAPDKDCVTYGKEWGTQLYKVGQYEYASWDEFGTAYYLITLSMDKKYASSQLIGGPQIANVSERNQFFRRPKSFTMDNLLRLSQPIMCPEAK